MTTPSTVDAHAPTDANIMHGTIINLAHLADKHIGRFLARWRENAHVAFNELVDDKFPEFNKAGRDDYWTWFRELGPEVIPQSELAHAATAWIERNPIIGSRFHTHEEILGLRINEIGVWVIHNFTSLNATIHELHNLGDHGKESRLRTAMVYAISLASNADDIKLLGNIRRFLRDYWMEYPSFTFFHIFEAAFPHKDKDRQKALAHWVKSKRRSLGNRFRLYKKEFPRIPKTWRTSLSDFQANELKSHLNGVRIGLLKYFGFFKELRRLEKIHGLNNIPVGERESLQLIESKVQRFMIAQNMFFPL